MRNKAVGVVLLIVLLLLLTISGRQDLVSVSPENTPEHTLAIPEGDFPLIRWRPHNYIEVLYSVDGGLRVREWKIERNEARELDDTPFLSVLFDSFSKEAVSLDGQYMATVNQYGRVVFCEIITDPNPGCRRMDDRFGVSLYVYGG